MEPNEPSSSPAPQPGGDHARERPHWRRILATAGVCAGILVASLAGAGGLVAARKRAPSRPAAPPRLGVRVHTIQPRRVEPELVGLGRARPLRRVALSFQVSGLAREVHADLRDGLTVTAGQPLVALDDADARCELERADAQLEQARVEVERLQAQVAFLDSRRALAAELREVASREVQRLATLEGGGVGSVREREAARQDLLRAEDSQLALETSAALLGPQIAAARARVREAEANRSQARLRLERTRIQAPFAGQVARVAVEPHQLVASGQVVCELWQVDRVEVPVALPLEEAALLAPDLRLAPSGYAVTARVRCEGLGPAEGWEGVLRRFEPVDQETQTVMAVVEVENRPGQPLLPPDVFCRVSLTAPPREATLALPLEALRERDQVYLVREGRLAVVTPRLGRRVGRWCLIEAGLSAGERVVVSPLERALEGTELVVVGEDGDGQG